MKWEVKELSDGRWGIFLCKEFWKFPDKPVLYSAAITKSTADRRVERLNNPGGYSNDENCVTVGMVRAKIKKEKEEKKKAKDESRISGKADKNGKS